MAKYISTKTYGTDRGLSCCFRQWKADHSHCSTLHGYSIGIKLIFKSKTLDEKNWVMDFGGLKAFKAWADYMFDHTMLIAQDDPHLETFKALNRIGGGYKDSGVVNLRVVEAVGCESFAKLAYTTMNSILTDFQNNHTIEINGEEYKARYPVSKDVELVSVEVFEHAGNSAIYEGNDN